MRRIWQAIFSMGASSVVTLLLSVVRAKIIAVQLGAPGVGILGIVTTSVLLAATALHGGLQSSGVRAVAAAIEDGDRRRDAVGLALIRGSWALALAGAVLVGLAWWAWGWALVPQVPTSVLAPWVAVAVGATIAAAANMALLNGLGRIGALAASTSLGALGGTALMVLAIQYSDRWGLIAAFAASPVATLVVSGVMVRWGYARAPGIPIRVWAPELRPMLILGIAFSGSAILTTATLLLARVWVADQLDIVRAGYLQACLAIAATYLGFILNALGAEYYPRVSSLYDDIESLNRSANKQILIVLTLGAPVIAWMVTVTPMLIRLLYDTDFVVASTLLRLLLVGDVFKLVGWCIGFILLARQAKTRFFLAELSWNTVFLVILIPGARFGLDLAGVAYLVAYVLYAFATLRLGSRETGFTLSRESRRALGWASLGVVATFSAASMGSVSGLVLSVATATVCTVVAARLLYGWSRTGGVSRD